MRWACRAGAARSPAAGRMAVLLALIDACGPAKSPPITTPPSQSPPQRWADLSAARAWPLAAPPFISRGHGGEHYLLEIRVTAAVPADYRALCDRRPQD